MEQQKSRTIEESDRIILEIVELCLAIDIHAFSFYKKLSASSENPELIQFWDMIGDEEKTHVDFWKKALDFAKKGMLPQIFDNPEEILGYIQNAAEKVEYIVSDKDIDGKKVAESFLTAFHIEFYCLHPALIPLFNVMNILSPGNNPNDLYDEHIMNFLEVFIKYCGHEKAEMQLLAEIIQRLWYNNRTLSRQCYMDELTGLMNRRGFFNLVQPLMELAKRNRRTIAVMLADIDDFKKINDTFGHLSGDAALTKIAEVFKSSFRASDLISRYGGEEFIVFCPEITPGAAEALAEKFRKAVREIPFHEKALSISIGVVEAVPAQNCDCPEEFKKLTRMADTLLYQAKNSGKNKTVFANCNSGQNKVE
ncbi:MAG: hypothetical protein A2017_04455 [Lentisphaerae bacterium GWF2_44_16]|nr:MAG: hypothetical protein A2017_04455 [Lentisphaerae bacterium GWF2_44_16]